jgi:hypothetical protein
VLSVILNSLTSEKQKSIKCTNTKISKNHDEVCGINIPSTINNRNEVLKTDFAKIIISQGDHNSLEDNI